MMLRLFRTPALAKPAADLLLSSARIRLDTDLPSVSTEWCYYVQLTESLDSEEFGRLRWLLAETFQPCFFSDGTFLNNSQTVIEVGPRLNFETAWSTTAVSICHACGLTKVVRLERSRRYGLPVKLDREQQVEFISSLYDRMTEMPYDQPLSTFDSGQTAQPVRIIPLIEDGINVLREINTKLGLGMDEQDMQLYFDLFVTILKRNPTDVELCQLGQSNSEHSRHQFFKGQLVIDGVEMPDSLMDIIKAPLIAHPGNSIVAFDDDSSAIRGFNVNVLRPEQPGMPTPFSVIMRKLNPILTIESHNHPTAIEPNAGSKTGIGGVLRDIFAMRRGGLIIASAAGYCTGNLHLPGYEQPWENDEWRHPDNLASPLDILIQASNGASDYGNCFGVPIIYGFTRTFGMIVSGQYRSWLKPIMYAGATGLFDDAHKDVSKPEQGMLVIQIGGPAYRIGVGGGSASSMISGDNAAELDLASVQRGDPQMEQRLYRVIKTCVELGALNPVEKAVDLGAGGDCNALSELVVPAGAIIKLRQIPVGDITLSGLEIWCNEAQERYAFLIRPDKFELVKEICEREDCPFALVGQVTGDGYLILHDENDGSEPVNLPLDRILDNLPQKRFELERVPQQLSPLELPDDLTVHAALDRVFRLESVGSKRYLTVKADRSVGGLIAQQQCVGPNQLTLADCAVTANSYLGLTGVARSLGEQPIKGLISPEAMARMAVSEMILNLAGARITQIDDIKLSGNWMLAAKEPGEGAWLYDAACALRDILIKLGIAIDGGKDSLSLAAVTKGPDGENHVVKAPGELVLAAYAPMGDITAKVTPDLKKSGNTLLLLDLSHGLDRLGGSALAQAYGQIGDSSPDVSDVDELKRTFQAAQGLISRNRIVSAHDRSDGGLIVTLCEMAFAGNVGIDIDITSASDAIPALFNEEPGLVIECDDPDAVELILSQFNISAQRIGTVGGLGGEISITHNGECALSKPMIDLRSIWEARSSEIDMLQANPDCVKSEITVNHSLITPPPFRLTFKPQITPEDIMCADRKPKVAILRERGSNGDREMTAAFYMAGFEPWEVPMTDLLKGRVSLDYFQGIAFVGGFSFADVLDAGKGWAGVIRFNGQLAEQFERFRKRPDTFSFGICNGCQLMALLGWIPWSGIPDGQQPRFISNTSGRFESRFATVRIEESPAIMLRGMAGSVLGVWVAHREGRFFCPDQHTLETIEQQQLAPIRFADADGNVTEAYPFNANSSPRGINALCSPDGRHLAMMPHPERLFLNWQWPWMPEEWKHCLASPWLKLFQNAHTFCIENNRR